MIRKIKKPATEKCFKLMQSGAAFHDMCEALIRSVCDAAGLAAAGNMLGRWLSDASVSAVD